ncbi:MAG: DUF262 domain-containing protein [Bacteroidaceae bacterium]|nr:DUF262 domain-containing protein [Bacteroidaceae bacterium]
MEARTFSIRKVFCNDTLFRIPFFQRRYVWNEEKDHNWSRFCNDLESTLEENRTYFLGSLILKSEMREESDRARGINERFELIDGQQRLTTLSVYMKLLHMMTNGSDDYNSYFRLNNQTKEPVIMHNCEDRPSYNRIIGLDNAVSELGDTNLIAQAYKYFHERFTELRDKEGVNLTELRNAIYANVRFVVITLDNNDNEQQIFDTINSLGVDLTTDELLKNYLYKTGDEDAYRNWRNMFDTDDAKKFWGTDTTKSRQQSTRQNQLINRFLHAYVRIKMWDFKDEMTAEQKKSFVKEDNVYPTCQAFVEKFGLDRQVLANEILEYAALFKKYFGEDAVTKRIPMYSCVERMACYVCASESYSVLPYLLFVLKRQNDANEVKKICGVLESYIMRRKLAASDDKMYSDLFSENLIGHQCLTADALTAYLISRDSALSVPTDQKISISMHVKGINEKTAILIYYMYETRLTPHTNTKFIGGFNDYSAKQLMPKASRGVDASWGPLNDPDEEEERKLALKTLGNYFMMYQISDKAYNACDKKGLKTKRDVMKQWTSGDNLVASSNALRTLASWTKEDIDKRTDDFCGLFSKQIWVL